MTNATLVSFRSMADGSGAPAIVECGGFRFAFDCLGEVTLHNITGGSRSPSKRVVALARWRYERELETLSAEWRAANRAMYSEEPHYTE